MKARQLKRARPCCQPAREGCLVVLKGTELLLLKLHRPRASCSSFIGSHNSSTSFAHRKGRPRPPLPSALLSLPRAFPTLHSQPALLPALHPALLELLPCPQEVPCARGPQPTKNGNRQASLPHRQGLPCPRHHPLCHTRHRPAASVAVTCAFPLHWVQLQNSRPSSFLYAFALHLYSCGQRPSPPSADPSPMHQSPVVHQQRPVLRIAPSRKPTMAAGLVLLGDARRRLQDKICLCSMGGMLVHTSQSAIARLSSRLPHSGCSLRMPARLSCQWEQDQKPAHTLPATNHDLSIVGRAAGWWRMTRLVGAGRSSVP